MGSHPRVPSESPMFLSRSQAQVLSQGGVDVAQIPEDQSHWRSFDPGSSRASLKKARGDVATDGGPTGSPPGRPV